MAKQNLQAKLVIYNGPTFHQVLKSSPLTQCHVQLGLLQKTLPTLREHLLSLVLNILISIYFKHTFLLRLSTMLQKTPQAKKEGGGEKTKDFYRILQGHDKFFKYLGNRRKWSIY